MRVSEKWLRQWVDPALDTAALAEQFTMAGLEVDFIEPAAAEFSKVVVGRIVELARHPEAERLQIASVDIGQAQALQIVCGAPNVAVNMYAPTALVGAVLPDGTEIRETELRGVTSQGMLCSAKELGLSEDGAGLLVLPENSEVGLDLRDLLDLDDQIIEIDLTPNRGDCLGMAGIAREAGVLNRLAVNPPPDEAVAPSIGDRFPVTLSAPADCPRYVGRVIRGVDAKAETPLWMRERLRRAGVRSLGPLIDITNYVLLEFGQPLHAFDLKKLSQGIDVRRAHAGESLRLLNGQTVELQDDVLLITDASGPIALAGIMGGETTEVDENTRDVFLEGAFFSPASIVGRARRFGLHTDASHRFERGVDPQLQVRAIERATRLIIDITGGEAGPVINVNSASHLPVSASILLRHRRIELLLGLPVECADIGDILQRLGMQIAEVEEGWQVLAPSFRSDITIEADLIEEIARIQGLDRLPISHPATHLQIASCPEAETGVSALRDVLVQRGYQEVITYSFIDPELHERFDPEHKAIPLANPISSEMAWMRTSLWPGLVKALAHNQKRQQTRLRLFETGLTFRGGLNTLVQEPYIGGVVCGNALPEQWGVVDRRADFFDLKGDVEALLALTDRECRSNFIADRHPALHPGQAARIEQRGNTLGWAGALHPRLARELELEGDLFLFELNMAALDAVKASQFAALSKFPASRRDLAVIVDEKVTAGEIIDSIRQRGGEILREITLFDVYRGKGVPIGCKSLAFGLILQDFSSNLTDQTIEQCMTHILSGLQQRFAASLRGNE